MTKLIDFYNQMMRMVDERRAVDVVYLNFRNAFSTVSHNTIKLKQYKLEK